jgi:hypothetical protein
MSDYQTKIRYSETECPDKYGRWARVVQYKEITIAYIAQVQGIYRVHLFFPVNSEANQITIKTFSVYRNAEKWAKKQFETFKTKIL